MTEWIAVASALTMLALSGQTSEVGEIGKRCPAPVIQVLRVPC